MNQDQLLRLKQHRFDVAEYNKKMQALLGADANQYALVEAMALSFDIQKALGLCIIDAFKESHQSVLSQAEVDADSMARTIASILHDARVPVAEKINVMLDRLAENLMLQPEFVSFAKQVDVELIGFQAMLADDGMVYVNQNPVATADVIFSAVQRCNAIYQANKMDREIILVVSDHGSVVFVARGLCRKVPPQVGVQLAELSDFSSSREYIVEVGAGSGIFGASVIPNSDKITSTLIQTECPTDLFEPCLWDRRCKLDLSSVATFGDSSTLLLLMNPFRHLSKMFSGQKIRRLLVNGISRNISETEVDAVVKAICETMSRNGELQLQWEASEHLFADKIYAQLASQIEHFSARGECIIETVSEAPLTAAPYSPPYGVARDDTPLFVPAVRKCLKFKPGALS